MFSKSQTRKKSDEFLNPIDVTNIESQLDIHQVEVTATTSGETLTSGTIAFFAKGSAPNAEWQPIQKDGADYELDLSTGIRSFDVPNSSIVGIRGIPDGGDPIVASGGTNWTLNIISGRKG